MKKTAQRPVYDIFSIRVSPEQKKQLQTLLKQAQARINANAKPGEYKTKRYEIAVHVLETYVPKLKSLKK